MWCWLWRRSMWLV